MQFLKSFLAFLFLSILIVSCGDNSEKSNASGSVEKQLKETSSNRSDQDATGNQLRLQNSSNTNASAGNGMTQTTPAGINPPHGQPGHDCKIPVGQPLDGSTLNMTNSAQNNTLNAGPRVDNVPQATRPQTQTAPGLNPPHGQPGHDCKIPVGQPLPTGN